MQIAIGADHRGFDLKERLKQALQRAHHQIIDCGTDSPDACDYPEIAYQVAKQVAQGQAERGILVCKSGIGMAIVANKVPAVRAALVHNRDGAVLSREHNDANVLVLSRDDVSDAVAEELMQVWLSTPAHGERHARRVGQIRDLEQRIRREFPR